MKRVIEILSVVALIVFILSWGPELITKYVSENITRRNESAQIKNLSGQVNELKTAITNLKSDKKQGD